MIEARAARSGSGIQCFGTGSDCEEDYPFGTFAELLAVPTTPAPSSSTAGAARTAQPCRSRQSDRAAHRRGDESSALLSRALPAGGEPDLFLRVIANTDRIHRSFNALGGTPTAGTVTSTNPTTRPDVSCTPIQTFCAREFSPGTPVTLTATPEPGHHALVQRTELALQSRHDVDHDHLDARRGHDLPRQLRNHLPSNPGGRRTV
ncbi:MAG: hypothetical protein R3F21_13025 [Myxococcota bacterium]